MNEQGYQSKIIKGIEDIGGEAINGYFTKTGTADLICGYPMVHYVDVLGQRQEVWRGLVHLHVEVKTKYDYERVFRSIEDVDGYYVFKDDISSLKKHEYLQITKLNKVRQKGGKALLAYSIEQVKEYMLCSTC